MSDLIKREDAKQAVYELLIYLGEEDINTVVETVLKEIPSAIVRCKECKHNPWNTDADYTCIWDDDFADREQTPDDFCSYGERKESE